MAITALQRRRTRGTVLLTALWTMISMAVLTTTSTKKGCCLSTAEAKAVDIAAAADDDGSIITPTSTSMPWQRAGEQTPPHSYMVVATVDGSVLVLDAQTGTSVQIFGSGMPLVSPSSHLPSGRRIVPGLDGRLYVTVLPHEQQQQQQQQASANTNNDGMPGEEDGLPPSEDSGGGTTAGNVLQPLGITVMDVLHNPVKTCNANNPHYQEDCGIVTATKSTSLFAIDSASGNLVWHQSPNGETIQHDPPPVPGRRQDRRYNRQEHPQQQQRQQQQQPKFTVLLQREDIMVQQISTDSGLSVWNVTLGSFQGLEFGSDSRSSGSKERGGGSGGDDMFLPGRRKPLDTNSNFLLDAPLSSTAPNRRHHDHDDEENELLPSVVFGSDGMTLTAVDPVHGTSLWNREFPTVVASVFGLNGKSWKPLTVLEGTAAEDSSSSGSPSDSGSAAAGVLPEGATGMALYRPPSMEEIFVQNEGYLEHLDFLYKLAEEQPYNHILHQQEQNRLLSPFPAIPDDLQSRRHATNKLLGWELDDDEAASRATTPRPDQLALPAPEDYTTLPHYDIRSEGVFLPWPVILALFCCAVVVFQKWYEHKKRQWYQDFEANAELTVTATSTDVTHGILEPEKPGGNPMRFLMHKERTINLRQQLSMPGDDQAPPGPPQVHNVSMTWVQPFDSNGVGPNGQPAAPEAAAAPIVPAAGGELQPGMLPPDDKPAQSQEVQEVGFLMDGIPLIRYCRYDSEFNEITALGKGGFGTVFQCQNVLDGREYAIKKVMLKSDSRQSQNQFQQRLQRTLREVKSLALLDHPNIVRYYTAWLELDNNSNEDTGADRGVGASDYYLFSGSNAGATTEAKTLTNRVSSWRRPSMEHLRRMTDFNPLGGWKTEEEEEEISFGHNIAGVPKNLEDYGFTFDRSDEEVHENDDAENSEWPDEGKEQTEESNHNGALVQYPMSFASQSSMQGLFARHHSMASVPSSVDESESKSCSNGFSASEQKSRANGKQEQTKGQDTPFLSTKHLLYIQMQFCSQKTLADFLTNKDARQGPSSSDAVDIPYALNLFLQIAQGVEHVHTQGLIHRDLKPNNCFIDESGVVKVGDFGLSREAGDSQEDDNAVDIEDDVNAIGDITAGVGTRSYASPEQMKGSDYDSSTDVYSLGIILFELCYPMYTGMERYIVMNKLRNQCFPDQWSTCMKPAFPGLHKLLVSMISNNPRDRPTAHVVVERIQSILSGLTISSLDKKHQHEGAILLRIEAQPREDVLRHTIELLQESARPTDVDVLQYGLRGGTNEAVMEFAISLGGGTTQDTSSMVEILVNRMKEYPEILLIRQVSATKYN